MPDLSALAALVFLSAHLAARADTDGPYAYTITDSHATVTNFDSAYSGERSITNPLGGFPVTRIGSSAFRYCFKLAKD